MKDKTIEILTEKIEQEFLPSVRRPARYIGGEVNQVRKDLSRCDLTFALCFPDVYEVGMSNLGLAILYHILNQRDGIAAERVFAPWTDAEQILRQKGIPLFSLESRASLRSFDVVGFSLTNELCYTNVLNMLDLAGIPVRRSDRTEDDPLIIAGGGMANCCEPVAAFIDLFVLGEGEEAIMELADLLHWAKRAGRSKTETLHEIARRFDWAYVPQFYDFEYENGRIHSFRATEAGLRTRFTNAVATDFENAPVPTRPLVPFAEAVHERVSIEIMRGCPGRCRFCQASFCRRPIRFRSAQKVFDLAKESYHASGFDTVSLLSLSTADYPHLEELVTRLHGYFEDKHVGLSIPSLRVDQQLKLVPKLFTSVRKSGLTIAVEAAGERLRQIINKPLKDVDLFATVEEAYRAGWQKLKLYFMVGLPGETLDDVKEIVGLCAQLARRRREVDGKTGNINITVSWFVPKPHTPLGWLPQRPREYFEQARRLILDEKNRLHAKSLQFKFHEIRQSILEAALGRGDRRHADVIEAAWHRGARFDLWDECFDYTRWQEAFAAYSMNLEEVAQRGFTPEELLPWEHLGGPDKAYLLTHYEAAVQHL
ncbi:MAG: TIGR03960 family B12-binding radical SAM protein [Planctomycetes bacterium]|nr:TIGR03960 family B12-binding radical SAM protein [Planctomycetota bacterium]